MRTLQFDRDRFAILFRYPETLTLTESVTIGRTSGERARTFDVGLMLTGHDLVVVSRQELRQDSRAWAWERLRTKMDDLVGELTSEVPSSTPVTLAGLPGLEYSFDCDGLHSWYTVLFDHAVMYTINCQSTPEGRVEIDRAGELIHRTMEHRDGQRR